MAKKRAVKSRQQVSQKDHDEKKNPAENAADEFLGEMIDEDINASETDEDADEGVGDASLGRGSDKP